MNKFVSITPDKERPFVSHRLWSLAFIIRALYGRAALLIENSFKKGAYQDWRTDSGTQQLLRSAIPAHIANDITTKTMGGLRIAFDYLEQRFLAEAGMQKSD